MRPGDVIFDEIDRGIRRWDKVLLCCSEASLNSAWVNREIDKALQKEEHLWKERGGEVLALIPLNLDGALFRWKSGKASELTRRLAPDFTGWEHDNVKFEAEFERVVKALRADDLARETAAGTKTLRSLFHNPDYHAQRTRSNQGQLWSPPSPQSRWHIVPSGILV